ncbi:DUF4398 domain-containing protein [Candidatus Sumerlaeota bacterium]|nr:DUF4398 domain-containing protein [Candidatus Sumerlaeota bacterium]
MPALSRPRAARHVALVLTLAVVAALFGCNQISSKRNLSRLERILNEIAVHEDNNMATPPYRPEEVLRLQADVNQVRDLIAREAYQEAADQGRRLMEQAPVLRDNVIADHAAAMRTRADEDISIAEQNDGQRENPELWESILETRDRSREANSEQEWEDVISYSQQIVDDVETLLLTLRNNAREGLNEANNAMIQFETLNSMAHVPDLVVESRDLTSSVAALIEDRQYRLAIATADQALTRINETVIETKRSIANQGIAVLEDLIAEMVDHGVDFRLGERYRTFSDNFDSLLGFYFNNEFDQALGQINMLTPIAQILVLDTYRAEANELIELRDREISELEQAEVRVYLPGRIDEVISLRDQAQARFDEALSQIDGIMDRPDSDFDSNLDLPSREQVLLDEVKPTFNDSVQLSVDAGDELESIHILFRELAESHLHDAQSAINVASDVLTRFDGIWDPRVTEAIEPSDIQFLQNRELSRQEIDTLLESARIKKATAEYRLNEAPARYNRAIVLADESRDEANQALSDTYTVATRYALIELTWMIDHYEREGAGEYVTEELNRTLRLVEETRATLDTGDPRDAVAKAADARAQLEIMIQSLRRVANERIQSLRELETSTGEMLANIQATGGLSLITELREAAERHARAGELKDAIETADRGLRLAERTTDEAAAEWAQTAIEDARGRIDHAEEAGASTYAATDLQDARDLLETARRRFTAGSSVEAQRAAAEASLRADEARMYLINAGEEAVVRAREYDGWRFQYQALSDAQVALQRARRAMSGGDFAQSRELALFGRQRADEVTELSRQGLFVERIEGVRQSVNHAMATGSNFFQPADLEAVLEDLTGLERSYTPSRHDDYERDLEALEVRMAMIIEATPEILASTLDNCRDWIRRLRSEERADLYAGEDLEQVAAAILAAEQCYESGHHRQSYREVVRAGRLLVGIQTMADEFHYKATVEQLIGDLEAARVEFADYINLSPNMLTYLAIDSGGSGRATSIVSGYSPSEFRREVERLQGLASEIEPPPTRIDHHMELLACLRNAQAAARNFEYLGIADRMDERTIAETVAHAYDFLETSRRQSTELSAALIEGPLAGPVTMTEEGRPLLERAMADHAYGFYHTGATARTR